MSTIDPVQRRAERAAARQGSPGGILRHVVLQTLQFVAAVVFGMGLVVMADLSRVTELNSVFGTWDSRLEGMIWAFPVGLMGMISLGIAVAFSAGRITGRPMSFPVVGPATVVLVGIALGFTLLAPGMTPPDQVGVRLDPSFGDSEAWGPAEWIWYRLDVWGPALLWVLAAAAAALGITARLRRRARRDLLADLVATGALVPGEVTEAPMPSPEAANTIARITVRYSDQLGTVRWVEPTIAVRTRDLPAAGATVAVVYDRNAPGDVQRIFVGPADARTADDFRRWNVTV